MPAVSKSQQQAAGIALSAKRGETPVSDLQGAAKEMYDSMTEKELKDFAETEHKGLPNKKESIILSKLFHEVRKIVKEELNEEGIYKDKDLNYLIDQLSNSMDNYDEKEFINHLSKETRYNRNTLNKIFNQYWTLDPKTRMKFSDKDWNQWLMWHKFNLN